MIVGVIVTVVNEGVGAGVEQGVHCASTVWFSGEQMRKGTWASAQR